ncbi:hypothetical protein BHE74_00003865 [Ensete ventricosum]|nr:hypothetical protein GW17_00019932 [Ensete ventricosum]RWW87315.1 hypothetical protein BHE74_00003865 [Ensete ventricosum]
MVRWYQAMRRHIARYIRNRPRATDCAADGSRERRHTPSSPFSSPLLLPPSLN